MDLQRRSTFPSLPVFRHRTIFQLFIIVFGLAAPVVAHNYAVHRDMTEMSFEIMLRVRGQIGLPANERRITRPPDVSANDWENFLKDIDAAAQKLRVLRNGLPAAKNATCLKDGSYVGLDWAFNKPLKDTRPIALDYKTGSDCGIEFNFKPAGI